VMTEPSNSNVEDLLLGPPGKSVDFYALLLAVIDRKRMILLLALACALAAWLILLRVPTTFRADVEILPPQINRGGSVAALLSQSGGAGDAAFGMLGSTLQAKTQSDTFVVILSAWPIQDSLVKQFDLVNAYHAVDAAQARDILSSRTTLKASKEGFIDIGIVDTDRKRAAAIANAYVLQARNFLHTLSLSDASQRRAFYERQLVNTKEDLAKAETDFRNMQQVSGMVSLDSQAKGLLEGAATLRSQITAKQVQIQSLRGYSTESNPQVQIAESELAELQKQLTQLESQGQGGYSGKSLTSVPASELAFVRATRELKYQEGLYDLLVKQYEGSRIDEARDAPDIQVIEPALVPDRKAGPRRMRDLAWAFEGGLVLGIIVALILHWKAGIPPADRLRWVEIRRAVLRW